MCAYAGESGPVELWQEGEPKATLQHLLNAGVCIAWNVGFERTVLARVWKWEIKDWADAMVLALYAGLPAGLKDCNRAPFFANESETSKETLLINKFCKPSKSGAKHDRDTEPEDWAAFCQYCRDDVHDTRLIHQWLMQRFLMPDRVTRAWRIDQAINDRGMPVDRLLTVRAWEEAQRLQALAAQQLKDVTGLENPNSTAQLLKWVQERGYQFNSLGKELVKKALADDSKEN